MKQLACIAGLSVLVLFCACGAQGPGTLSPGSGPPSGPSPGPTPFESIAEPTFDPSSHVIGGNWAIQRNLVDSSGASRQAVWKYHSIR